MHAPRQSTNARRFHLLPLDYACMLSFMAYAAASTVTPICLVHISREFDLSLAAGGGIETARATLLLAVLLVSAFCAARWGKARSLGGASLLLGGCLLLYALAPSYGLVLLTVALIGAGSGMIEALNNPLVQDLHPGESGRYLNFHNAFWSLGVFVTVLAGGEWLTRGLPWRALVAVVGSVAMATGILYILLDRTRPHVPVHSVADVWGHKTAILRAPRFHLFALLMVLAGGAEGAFTFWSASYIQLHYGATPRMGGIGTACFAGGMLAGRLAGGWLAGQARLRRLLLASALGGIGISLIIPRLTAVVPLLGALVLAGLCIACFWPTLQSYAADRLPVESTSLFILMSCAGIPGYALTAWAIGVLGDRIGLQQAFLIVPAMLALFVLLMLVEHHCPPRTGGRDA